MEDVALDTIISSSSHHPEDDDERDSNNTIENLNNFRIGDDENLHWQLWYTFPMERQAFCAPALSS